MILRAIASGRRRPGTKTEEWFAMKSRISRLLSAAAVMMLAIAWCMPPAHAEDKATVRAGYLTCHVSSGWGFIFGSSRTVKCAYTRDKNYTEYYTGSITKFGADIGYLSSAVILWAVVAPTTNLGEGALAGHYGGATASVALGVGADLDPFRINNERVPLAFTLGKRFPRQQIMQVVVALAD